MKCIINMENGKISRVSDTEADRLTTASGRVATQKKFRYIDKDAWKKQEGAGKYAPKKEGKQNG